MLKQRVNYVVSLGCFLFVETTITHHDEDYNEIGANEATQEFFHLASLWLLFSRSVIKIIYFMQPNPSFKDPCCSKFVIWFSGWLWEGGGGGYKVICKALVMPYVHGWLQSLRILACQNHPATYQLYRRVCILPKTMIEPECSCSHHPPQLRSHITR